LSRQLNSGHQSPSFIIDPATAIGGSMRMIFFCDEEAELNISAQSPHENDKRAQGREQDQGPCLHRRPPFLLDARRLIILLNRNALEVRHYFHRSLSQNLWIRPDPPKGFSSASGHGSENQNEWCSIKRRCCYSHGDHGVSAHWHFRESSIINFPVVWA
jgi:hypothetical protein